MAFRDVGSPFSIPETAGHRQGAFAEADHIVVSERSIDRLSDECRHRNTPAARFPLEAAGLRLCELDLSPNHDAIMIALGVSTL